MASPESPPDLDDRLRFLFGKLPAAADRVGPEQWTYLLLDDRPEIGDSISGMMLRVGIAARLLRADPTGTWAEVQRRLAAGTERHAVMDELVAELTPLFDAAYDACVELVQAQGVIAGADLERALHERLALDPTDPITDAVLRDALERLLLDPHSDVAGVPSGALVHVPTLLGGCVLTHHLSDVEAAEGRLVFDPDLAVFGVAEELRTAAGPLAAEVDEAGLLQCTGPAGWLPQLGAGEVLTVRTGDGGLELGTAPGDLPAPPELVSALRAVYDGQIADPPLPLTGDLLTLGVLAADPAAFAQPVAPLAELAAAAGLQQRGREFGHSDDAWTAAEQLAQSNRLAARLDDHQVARAEAALDLVAAGAPTDNDLRTVLGLLDDADVLLAVADELLGSDGDAEQVAAAVALGDRFVSAAGSSARSAAAHAFASLAVERAGRLDDAESHLRAAAAVSQWWLVDERLAWYASDRGRAAEALGYLQDAGLTEAHQPVEVLTRYAVPVAVPGRNDPCWCGSGRKFKQCHRDQPPLPPLAERVPWLEQKTFMYLDLRSGAADVLVDGLADVLAGGDGDPESVLDDPLLADVALVEGGWLARFVEERGPLLPQDEAVLAAAWAATSRKIYEIVGIGYGTGVTVREIGADGDGVRVADQDVAKAVTAGELVSGRVVADGAGGLRFSGVVTAVPRGREDELREVLDAGDPYAVLDWLAEAEYLG
ncbi:YecA family protein [Pseudonocardia sp. CA-107938]|uniref:YecA family protein n=1 Tax=Pseudonocardia sp. CA-107938 TaxID=3240021 RepID=UPI003D93E77F